MLAEMTVVPRIAFWREREKRKGWNSIEGYIKVFLFLSSKLCCGVLLFPFLFARYHVFFSLSRANVNENARRQQQKGYCRMMHPSHPHIFPRRDKQKKAKEKEKAGKGSAHSRGKKTTLLWKKFWKLILSRCFDSIRKKFLPDLFAQTYWFPALFGLEGSELSSVEEEKNLFGLFFPTVKPGKQMFPIFCFSPPRLPD